MAAGSSRREIMAMADKRTGRRATVISAIAISSSVFCFKMDRAPGSRRPGGDAGGITLVKDYL